MCQKKTANNTQESQAIEHVTQLRSLGKFVCLFKYVQGILKERFLVRI